MRDLTLLLKCNNHVTATFLSSTISTLSSLLYLLYFIQNLMSCTWISCTSVCYIFLPIPCYDFLFLFYLYDLGSLLEIWVTSCWSKISYTSKWSLFHYVLSWLSNTLFISWYRYNYGINPCSGLFACNFFYPCDITWGGLTSIFSLCHFFQVSLTKALILQVLLSTDLNALFATTAFVIPSTLYVLLQLNIIPHVLLLFYPGWDMW
jgi:hypothetical protein